MGVPRTDEQSKAILEAASRILSADGAGALTVRRIASEAGCSTMGLYSRFGGKEGVVDELYVEGFQHLCEGMSACPKTDDPVADLRACRARIARPHWRTRRTTWSCSAARCRASCPPRRVARVALGAFDRLVANVQRCIDAGAFKGDAAEIAEVWWGSMHGLVMLEVVGVDPVKGDPSVRFDRLLDTLLDGLRFEGLHA